MRLVLNRDYFADGFTLGKMYMDGVHLGFTAEDTDRRVESGGEKVPKQTAMPRGKFLVTLSHSNRFDKIMPEVHNVPQFTGVRIHGGNTAEDTEGCPLLGKERTGKGVRNCAAVNEKLIRALRDAADRNEKVYLEVV